MGISLNFNQILTQIYTIMSLLKITMKLVCNYYSSFKDSKYKMAAKFGQKKLFLLPNELMCHLYH